jgi:nitrogen fixation NifU-like protein
VGEVSYSKEVLERFESTKNAGTLDKDDLNVGTGLVGAPACGDVLRLQIRVNPETGIIEEARWKGFGCGSLIASSQYACELIEGRTLAEAESVQNSTIVEALTLPPV